MTRLALNFICKNEAHIIDRMLESVRPIVDLIVAVDTGSTDDTISIIHQFGKKYSIPTFVSERPFDNFCNSRNYAMDKLSVAVHELKWNSEQVWGFFIDCDEVIQISDQFQKGKIVEDMYVVSVQGADSSFIRQFCFRLGKGFRWIGPIHEILVCEESPIYPSVLEHVIVQFESAGGSWKGDLEKKFLHYAELLTKYIEDGHYGFRWVYYAASSYQSAAEYSKSKARKRELEILAERYFEKANNLDIPSIDEEITLLCCRANNNIQLGERWPIVKRMLYKAYAIDIRRAEAVARIIEYYMEQGSWSLAYAFSHFAILSYDQKSPYGQGVAEVNNSLYAWKLVMYHFVCCFQTGRKTEAKVARNRLRELGQSRAYYFSENDLLNIRSNSAFNLMIRNFRTRIGLN